MKKSIIYICIVLTAYLSNAQTKSIPAGSVILDMGVVPQTEENALLPYGLVYTLIKNFDTPVIWSINTSKAKDGIDFTVDGKDFKGGPFIIESTYLTQSVLDEIAIWVADGVVTHTTLSNVIIPLHKELEFFANWVLDTDNGDIAEPYIQAAGIPISAYRTSLPTGLTNCDDLFILPHADPTWTNHGESLFTWNAPTTEPGGHAGWIWAGCHAVSVLEGLVDPNNNTRRTNFLSVDPTTAPPAVPTSYGLINFGNHADASGSTPYQSAYPGDPFMQFMGLTDNAHSGGSEQIFLPSNTGGWRSTTKIGAWDSNQINVLNNNSPGEAALIAFGPGMGDTSRGYIMYEGGHRLDNGTEAENVAAIRAFMNFSFDAPTGQVPTILENSSPPTSIAGGQYIDFDVTGTIPGGGTPTYTWTTSCGTATFDDNTIATPRLTFTTPLSNESCLVTVTVEDSCGRSSISSWNITVTAGPTAPVAVDDAVSTYNTSNIAFNALVNDTDANDNIDPTSFTPTSNLTVAGGTFIHNGNGNVAFIPTVAFSGTATLDYQICDTTLGTPLCDTATITVTVLDSPCNLGETVIRTTAYPSSIEDENKWKNENNALGAPDGSFSDSDDDNGAFIEFDLGANTTIALGTDVIFTLFSDDGKANTGTIEFGSTTSYTEGISLPVTVNTKDPNTETYTYTVVNQNLRYIKVSAIKDFGIESITYETETCSTVPDTDGDGIIDTIDIDSDNDGIIDITESAGNEPYGDEDGDTILNFEDNNDNGNGGDSSTTNYTDTNNDGIPNVYDTDNDGVPNHLDLDSDNDGIPDNIEAQGTLTYIAPTGTVGTNGLDSAYEISDSLSDAGLTPQNTDGTDNPDYLDTDSDNEGANDTTEAGLTLSGTVGNNGLDDNYDTGDNYIDINGDFDYSQSDNFPDTDSDISTGGDADWRDDTAGSDADGDGVFDTIDLDDDNDGILDTIEGTGDTDADGIPNYLDLDSDGDGIPDNIEAQTTNGYVAPNTDNAATYTSNSGVNSAYLGGLTPVNTDKTDNPDYLDLDSDNQGGTDSSEAGIFLSGNVGSNGLDNSYDNGDDYSDVNGSFDNTQSNNFPDIDGDVLTGGDVDWRDDFFGTDPDGDGVTSETDLDDDNDGILDTIEGTGDPDGDGIPNYLDLDSDGDGIPDNIEAQSTSGYIAPNNSYDSNGVDTAYTGGLTPINTDGTDSVDYLDLDSDNQGANDTSEAGLVLSGNVGDNGLDNNYDNGDDYSDVNGAFDNSQTDNFPDNDGDAPFGGDVDWRDDLDGLDTDGDGILNENDIDDDNDGILDTIETNGKDPDADEDNDGIPNFRDISNNGSPYTDSNSDNVPDIYDSDLDGIPNHLDLDADNDGIPDNIEAQTTVGYIAPNNAYNASGLDTAYTGGLTPVNTDGTDNPDYLDTDSDNEGSNDTAEAGLTLSGNVGVNGLDNNYDNGDDYSDTNGSFDNTQTDNFPDTDLDVNSGGDVNWRDAFTIEDTDGDGILNNVDIDDDNDGIIDSIESGIYNPDGDEDGDEIPNYKDTTDNGNGGDSSTTSYIDSNSDGTPDVYDFDGDGVPNHLDIDADSDGTPDIEENGDTDNTISGTDTDGDGLDDNFEGANLNDGYDVNDEINAPSTDLPDSDIDISGTGDVDYRDDIVNPITPAAEGNILWLRADIEASTTSWQDQSGNDHDAVNGTNAPTMINDALNFNPVFSFDGVNQFMEIAGGILGNNESYSKLVAYTVTKTTAASNSYVFEETTAANDEFLICVPWGDNEVYFGIEGGTSNINFTWESTAGVYDIYNFYGSTTGNTPLGTKQALYRNGNMIGTDTDYHADIVGDDTENFTTGVGGGTSYFEGDIAEIMIFNIDQSSAEQQNIQSYLAIKYGITLGTTDNDSNITEGDYLLKDLTTKVWDYSQDFEYHNDVAGIGRDDALGLEQVKSKSVNSEGLLTIEYITPASKSAGSKQTFATKKFNNNKDFLVWGNDRGSLATPLTSTLLCSPYNRVRRKWKIRERGNVGNVKISIPKTTVDNILNTSFTEKYLIVSDNASFSSNVRYTLLTENGSNYEAIYDFDGVKFFSYAEVNGIFWNGNLNTWTGGNGTGNSASTNAADIDKVMVIDSESSLTHATLAENADIECVWIKSNSKLTVNDGLYLKFDEDFVLDGELRLTGQAQLIQTHTGTSNVAGNGKLYRDQQSTVPNVYRYNYWSSPVVKNVGDTSYAVGDVMKDGSTPTSETSDPADIVFTASSYDGSTNPTTIANYWIWSYLSGTTGADWAHKRDTGAIPIGAGYTMKSTGDPDQNFTFVGTPNDGTIEITVSENTTSLLGNPYPSELNIANFINDNIDPQNNNSIDGTLYFWEHKGETASSTVTEGHNIAGYIGGYSTRNLIMGVAASAPTTGTAGTGNTGEQTNYTYRPPGTHVAIGQGFFVGALDGIGNNAKIIFNNSQRTFPNPSNGENSVFLKGKKNKASKTAARLQLLKIGFEHTNSANAVIHRQIGIAFKEGSSFDFDNGQDSFLYDMQDTDAYWQFPVNENKYAIATVGAIYNNMEVPIVIKKANDVIVQLRVDVKQYIDAEIYLKDNTTNQLYDMTETVNLSLPEGTYTDRFTLLFKQSEVASIEENELNQVAIYYLPDSKEINLVSPYKNLIYEKASLLNTLGIKVKSWNTIQEGTIKVHTMPDGVYIFQLSTNQGIVTKKVAIY